MFPGLSLPHPGGRQTPYTIPLSPPGERLDCDVLVAGSGNAGFSAAISAAESGAGRVVLIEKSPEEWSGGNSFFTAGAFRTVHGGLDDLLPIVNNVDKDTAQITDMEPYTSKNFTDDLLRMTANRTDAELSKILVQDSNSAVKWLAHHGVRFQLSFNRQAYKVDGRYKFWGGMSLKTEDGGKGLIQDHLTAARRLGVTVLYSTPLKGIIKDQNTGAVTGARVEHNGQERIVRAKAVILAAGGFEANSRMRAQYLGPGWDLALVRGTPFNVGDCLETAIRDVSAKQAGNWSGCHSVAWDANAPANSGDREISNQFTKSGYPLGLMLNSEGERFVDEGIDMRNYTYAKFGRAILAQPDNIAFQIWDQQTISWLRPEEYRPEIVEHITGSTIEELAEKCAQRGLHNKENFVKTISDYNEAVYQNRRQNPNAKWNPAVKDRLSTQSRNGGLALAKTNWALPLDKGPFLAVKVSCGITFTFGGLAVNPQTAAVISSASNKEIPGLYCVGEMLGGLFYGNYPGGSGLTAGAVFGRRAGAAAAARVSRQSVVDRARL
ncbi:FAD binding domain containing protein [Coccidioides posadasii C735 delta SOWgp]|uniref:FAD binding domain containing protein n=1 Tax=Coccidioides posadasii (strain C735) TaxID=222929 RepID=C5P1C3_COCP7|nr:FAD binding domain containing protein [Coccidioides posadasii C735 delta SOWgp]EER29481.1 FAD binding domain containing protein [Coccidioides posadasii C735 delta SOWgp]|eukprot:XP_003071626.1 FAD binding domain containing protein [Coccidioides posadasii C735 delta SOWgp]